MTMTSQRRKNTRTLSDDQMELILRLVSNEDEGRYLNLDSGRLIKRQSAKVNAKLAYVDHVRRFATSDRKLFKLISAALDNTIEALEQPTPERAYRIIVAPRPALPYGLRDEVWLQYCGAVDNSRCYCCRTPISRDNWICAHVTAIKHGGLNELDNLRPTCRSCNSRMGTTNLFLFIAEQRLPGPSMLSQL